MKRVTGIGGIFFKAKDVEGIKAWYREQLGFEITQWGAGFVWGDIDPDNTQVCSTAWSVFKNDSNHFAPGTWPYMINYRVHDLNNLIDTLRGEGVEVVGGVDEYDYGKFAWIMDGEGRKIELWEPVDSGFGEAAPPWTKKVVGLGGIYLRSDDPARTRAWYKKHLGIEQPFASRDLSSNKEVQTRWDVLDKKSEIFSDTDKPYVFAYRVNDPKIAATIFDPEGNKIILTP